MAEIFATSAKSVIVSESKISFGGLKLDNALFWLRQAFVSESKIPFGGLKQSASAMANSSVCGQ